MKYSLIVLFLISFKTVCSQDSSAYSIACDNYVRLKFDRAVYWFAKSIERKYRVADSYRYMGASKALMKDFNGAKRDLFYSLQLDPSSVRTYYHFGKYYYLAEKYDSSLFWYNKAIRKDPGDADFYDSRAMSYVGEKKLDSALLDENTAIRLKPGQDVYYNNRGLIRQRQLKYSEALSDYKSALLIDSSFDSHNIATYINVAFCHFKIKNYGQALQECDKILLYYPDTPYALRVRGEIYCETSRKDEGCKDFNRLFELDREMAKEYLEKYCK